MMTGANGIRETQPQKNHSEVMTAGERLGSGNVGAKVRLRKVCDVGSEFTQQWLSFVRVGTVLQTPFPLGPAPPLQRAQQQPHAACTETGI